MEESLIKSIILVPLLELKWDFEMPHNIAGNLVLCLQDGKIIPGRFEVIDNHHINIYLLEDLIKLERNEKDKLISLLRNNFYENFFDEWFWNSNEQEIEINIV